MLQYCRSRSMTKTLIRDCLILALLLVVSCFNSNASSAGENVMRENVEMLLSEKSCPNCDLQGADLTRAELNGANLNGANLQGAKLMLANLVGANLNGADLRGAQFGGADLAGADLRKTLAHSDTFEGVYLVGALRDDKNNIQENLHEIKAKTMKVRDAQEGDQKNDRNGKQSEEGEPAVISKQSKFIPE